MGLVPLRQGDGHPQGDEPEVPGAQGDLLRRGEVDPVGFPRHVTELLDVV